MNRSCRHALSCFVGVALTLATVGCSLSREALGTSDVGPRDGGPLVDMGTDTGEDAWVDDVGLPDGGMDAGIDGGNDGGPPDTGPPDTGPPDAACPMRSPPTVVLTPHASHVAAGADIGVSYGGFTGTPGEWVGIGPQCGPGNDYLMPRTAWDYATGSSGSAMLHVPPGTAPGTYEFRAYPASSFNILGVATFQID